MEHEPYAGTESVSPSVHPPDRAKPILLLTLQAPKGLLVLSGPFAIAHPVEELSKVHMTLLVRRVELDDAFVIGERQIILAEFQRQVGAGGQGGDVRRVESDRPI
jgi:hypothetical protein